MEAVGPAHFARRHLLSGIGGPDDRRFFHPRVAGRQDRRRRHGSRRAPHASLHVFLAELAHGLDLGAGGGRHHGNVIRHLLPFGGVHQPPVRQQHQAVFPGQVKHARGPGHPAGVVAPQHRAHVAGFRPHIFKPAKHLGGNGDHIAGSQPDLPFLRLHAPAKGPAAVADDEHLRRLVAVLRVHAMGRLAHAADVEPVGDVDMHMLLRAFRHPGADDGEVLLLVARRAGVDKSRGARH